MHALASVLDQARQLGFLGPGPVQAHIDHAWAFAVAVGDAPRDLVDLGSGGGVPGLVLAACWPETIVMLVEAAERRARFLADAVESLGMAPRVSVTLGRAEELGRLPDWRGRFPAVTARGFGPPPVVAECAAPFLRPGGTLVTSEPPNPTPTRWDPAGLAALGMELGASVTAPFRFQRILQRTPCPERYPRRVGVPARRPLWAVSRETEDG